MSITQKQSSSTGLAYLSNSPPSVPKRLVLCISGLGAPSSDYLPLLQILAKEKPHNLYLAPDLPGHGDSLSSLCPKPTFSAFIELLGNLCDEFGCKSTDLILIGHSMGCRLALEIFSQSPNKVPAVILLDGNWNGPEPPKINLQALPPRNIQLEYLLKGLETTFGPDTPEEFKEGYRRRFREADLDYLAQLTFENRLWDANRMIDVLKQLQTFNKTNLPTTLLLIQATDSSNGLRRSLKKREETSWMKLAREHAGSGCSCVTIEDSGHWPQIDKTNEVAEAVLSLIGLS